MFYLLLASNYTPSNKENSPVLYEWAGEALNHWNNHTWFFLILKELFEAKSVP